MPLKGAGDEVKDENGKVEETFLIGKCIQMIKNIITRFGQKDFYN